MKGISLKVVIAIAIIFNFMAAPYMNAASNEIVQCPVEVKNFTSVYLKGGLKVVYCEGTPCAIIEGPRNKIKNVDIVQNGRKLTVDYRAPKSDTDTSTPQITVYLSSKSLKNTDVTENSSFVYGEHPASVKK